jgi:ribosomal protein L37AE/L43A
MAKLNKCKRCGGDAHIIKMDGDWIATCKQCDNNYHGCDYKPWTRKHWNEQNS